MIVHVPLSTDAIPGSCVKRDVARADSILFSGARNTLAGRLFGWSILHVDPTCEIIRLSTKNYSLQTYLSIAYV